MTTWRLIDSGFCDAAYNMALDEAIATAVRSGESYPTMRFYGWGKPSVSIGAFQKIMDIDIQYCTANDISVVRRPTGGRGILHEDELTYSFSSKNDGLFSHGLLKTYQILSSALMSGIAMLGIEAAMKIKHEPKETLIKSSLCFKSTSYGEISFKDRKIVGSAQKRWKDGFLQQGSIPFSVDHAKLSAVFKVSNELCVIGDRSKDTGHASRITCHDYMAGLRDLIQNFNPDKLKQFIKSSFEQTFNIRLVESRPSPQELELAHRLSFEKYRNPLWTLGEGANRQFCNNNKTLKTAL